MKLFNKSVIPVFVFGVVAGSAMNITTLLLPFGMTHQSQIL